MKTQEAPVLKEDLVNPPSSRSLPRLASNARNTLTDHKKSLTVITRG